MCLAIPGKVLTVERDNKPVMGKVSFAGMQRSVCLDWIPDVEVGQYVLVHVGFALNTIDEAEARKTLKMLEEMEEMTRVHQHPPEG